MRIVVRKSQVIITFVYKNAVYDGAVFRKIFIYTDNLDFDSKRIKHQGLSDRIVFSEYCFCMTFRQQCAILFIIFI